MEPQKFGDILKHHQITHVYGVPDSILQPWVNYLNQNGNRGGFTHIKAINECEAIALASGYHIASEKIAMVYMQNSGLGKAVNPLTSLVDKEVYSIPILLLIGWRGEPGKTDDPQHKKMGRIMMKLLDCLEIPYQVLSNEESQVEHQINTAFQYLSTEHTPYALICQNTFFHEFLDKSENSYNQNFCCDEAISAVLDRTNHNEVILSTTGRVSRALNHLRKERGDHLQDFFTLGSMGCVSAIALGISSQTTKSVLVLDGDGSVLMQMGTLASIGNQKPKNLYHIIFDNNGYCSTGCQPTISDSVDFELIARGCSYKFVNTANNLEDFKIFLEEMLSQEGPGLLVAKVRRSRKKYLARLQDPETYKKLFRQKLKEG